MTGTAERHVERFLAALVYPLTSAGRAGGAVVAALATYAVLVLSAFPSYTVQMFRAGLAFADDALLALTANAYTTAGWFGVALIVAYAVLTGVAVVVAAAQVRMQGVGNAGGLAGTLPGLLASGCASCGAGVLGLVAGAGALATLPFHGNLLRLAGLALLVGYLSRVGDPRQCAVDAA